MFGLEHFIIGIHESFACKDVFADKVFKVVDVLRVVEFEELLSGGMPAFIDVHFPVEVEGLYQRVGHGHSFGLHWMVFVVKELAHIVVVKI